MGALLAVLAAAMLAGCATVPETGRSQLNLISADEEMKLGVTEFQNAKQKTPISRDAAANRHGAARRQAHRRRCQLAERPVGVRAI